MARFRWDAPAAFAFPEDVFDAWAEDRGRLAACGRSRSGDDARATFWDLRDASRRLAGLLAEAGVGAGSRVAVALPFGLEWAVAQLAVLRLRAVGATLDPAAVDGLTRALSTLSPYALIADGATAVKLGEAPVAVRASVDGSTPGWLDARGAPGSAFEDRPRPSAESPVRVDLGVCTIHARGSGWLHAQRRIAEFWLDLRRTDLFWPIVAPDDPLALALVIGAWSLGTPVLFRPADDPEAVLRGHPISVLHAPGSVYERIAGVASRPGSDLRHCATADRLGAEPAEAWREATGLAIHTGFGVPECPLLLAHLRGLPVRPGSVGRPLPGHDVRVVDGSGAETEDEAPGEIVLHGCPPTLALDDSASARASPLRTGVRAWRDAQGYVWLADPVA